MSKRNLSFSKGVLLKGLPFNTSVDEIKTFFKAISIPEQNINIIKFRDGQQTGVGFVKLKDEQMEHALLMDKNHIGKRYVEVIPSDETELHHLVLKARSGEVDAREINRLAGREVKKGVVKRDRSPIRKRLQTRFAYMTGIPAQHQYKEVRRFFKGILIGMNCIHLLKEPGSREFRGDGYVEFKDNDECRKALFLDGETMDGHVVRLEPCTQDDFEHAIRHMMDSGNDRPVHSHSHSHSHRSPSPRFKEEEGYFTPAYREREGRYRNTIATMAYGGHGVIDRSLVVRDEPYDRPSQWRDSPIPLDSPVGSSDRGHGHIPLVTNHSYSHVEEKYPPVASLGSSSLFSGPATTLGPQKPLMGSPTSLVERKIVRLEGLPYDATLHDIVDFFRGFNVNLEHVRIQCRDDGSPSGKAFVTFHNEKYAQTAVRDMNRKYVRGRMVELFLV